MLHNLLTVAHFLNGKSHFHAMVYEVSFLLCKVKTERGGRRVLCSVLVWAQLAASRVHKGSHIEYHPNSKAVGMMKSESGKKLE